MFFLDLIFSFFFHARHLYDPNSGSVLGVNVFNFVPKTLDLISPRGVVVSVSLAVKSANNNKILFLLFSSQPLFWMFIINIYDA